MEQEKLKNIIEAILLSAEKPLKVNQIEILFAGDNDAPTRDEIRKVLAELQEDYKTRGFDLIQVASGYRIQVKQDYSQWVGRLWEEKPARYSRALLETIALIAYRQPITRGEIEEVRGVSVSSNIIKTLMEREWIKVLGHKDVPGKPALYGTSKEFLDYFNLKSLDELPTLAEIKDLDQIHQELDLDGSNAEAANEANVGEADVDAEAVAAETETAEDASDSEAETSSESIAESEDEIIDEAEEADEETVSAEVEDIEATDAEAELDMDTYDEDEPVQFDEDDSETSHDKQAATS
jgi:segregation and condensation protein B